MKIVFSRKGFDSASGGCPSPILPDGRMLALPIPDARSPIRYRDLSWNGRNLGDVVESLTKGRVRANHGAHLDPDLLPGALPRTQGWRPVLGQCGAAQGHLRNQQVGPGDLFVFWGLFRRVDEQLRWLGPLVHVVWGWMRVGEVVSVDRDVRPQPRRWRWAARHPHLAFEADTSNTLYLADGVTGAGVFERYSPERQLTAPEAPSPTIWDVPTWMAPRSGAGLSYHLDPARWTTREGRLLLRCVGRGQEFVLDTGMHPEAEAWLGDLLMIAKVTRSAKRSA